VKRPISIAGRQTPFAGYYLRPWLPKPHEKTAAGRCPSVHSFLFVFGLYSSAKSPASLRSPKIYKGSVRGPYVRFVRAPPSNGISPANPGLVCLLFLTFTYRIHDRILLDGSLHGRPVSLFGVARDYLHSRFALLLQNLTQQE
jgi:hypothetical protein